jgi:hypothetical protein
MKDRIIWLFCFKESTVTGGVYFDMVEQFMFVDLQPNIICQEEGAPPHWNLHIPETFARNFSDHWIGHDGSVSWPSCLPGITVGFIFVGCVKD